MAATYSKIVPPGGFRWYHFLCFIPILFGFILCPNICHCLVCFHASNLAIFAVLARQLTLPRTSNYKARHRRLGEIIRGVVREKVLGSKQSSALLSSDSEHSGSPRSSSNPATDKNQHRSLWSRTVENCVIALLSCMASCQSSGPTLTVEYEFEGIRVVKKLPVSNKEYEEYVVEQDVDMVVRPGHPKSGQLQSSIQENQPRLLLKSIIVALLAAIVAVYLWFVDGGGCQFNNNDCTGDYPMEASLLISLATLATFVLQGITERIVKGFYLEGDGQVLSARDAQYIPASD